MRAPPETPVAEAASPGGGARRLTLLDVAQALGVSRTTVSNAFNRPDRISAALRERIISESRALGYFGPDPAARAMRRGGVHEVAVIFHHDLVFALNDPPSIEFLRGVAKVLDARGVSLQLVPYMGRRVDLAAAFQTTADALIVHAEVDPGIAPEVQAMRKPIVLVDAYVSGVTSVGNRDREGAAAAMAHALAARPDRVLLLSFPVDPQAWARVQADPASAAALPRLPYVPSERMAGYVAAAHRAGFALDRLIWIELDDSHPEAAAERVAEIRGQLPAGCRLAVVAMSDRMALSARPVVESWPEVQVVAQVGFDDIEAAALAGLTTVRQDARLKGERAAEALLDGTLPELLPVELVLRRT
ncbi:LacI family DNA-binding transcriptional regulator [Sphaerotilus microaerophilus]|uniref:Transcriptional regulator n=1 Tax=Sphaerotilus microaerophilus TaxID=2914710 RepID=A0ABM7YHA8_9BURK|nr:LacI family DNA-binding transcriptional regulator [Sphaerotilus sp. FB-5]BDI03589.1 transcriptional regulator [Sphaerotilus sp. FB-5]